VKKLKNKVSSLYLKQMRELAMQFKLWTILHCIADWIRKSSMWWGSKTAVC